MSGWASSPSENEGFMSKFPRLPISNDSCKRRIRKVGQVKLEDLIDDSIVRELDKTGYFEHLNAEYGVK